MKSIFAAVASAALFLVPASASAAEFTYAGDFCLNVVGADTECDTFTLVINTTNGTAAYTVGPFTVPATWAFDSVIGAAFVDLDFTAINPDLAGRLIVFPGNNHIEGGVVSIDAEIALGTVSADRVPTVVR